MKIFSYVGMIVRTIISYTIIGIGLVVFFFPCLLSIVILPDRWKKKKNIIFTFLDWTYRWTLFSTFLPITIMGREYIQNIPSIIVANHQSSLDVLLIGSLMRKHPHIWYALQFVTKKPLIGYFLKHMGMPLDRDNPTSAAQSFIKGIRIAQSNGEHLIIFPEGERHVDGKVHEFLKGFVILAKKTKRPVIPVYMPYNYLVYPSTAWLIRWHELQVIVGEPLFYTEDDTDESFAQRVYDWFLKHSY